VACSFNPLQRLGGLLRKPRFPLTQINAAVAGRR
jgi:hypothetical protein